jgi:hypothetical protein
MNTIPALRVMQPSSYVMYKLGTSYFAENQSTGVTTSNPTFTTLLGTTLTSLSSTGGDIFFRKGIYYFPSSFSSGYNNIGLYGERGTIFKANATPAETYMFGWYGTAGTHISNFILDGIEFDYSDQLAGTSIKWCDHVRVKNDYFHSTIHDVTPPTYNSQFNGLDVWASTGYEILDVEIANTRFEDNWSAGVGVSYANYVDIHDNYCYNNAPEYPGGGGIKTDVGANNVHIHDNRIYGTTANDGIYGGATAAFPSIYTIDHNIIILTPDNGVGHFTAGIKTYINDAVIDHNNILINNAYNGSVGIASFGTGCNVDGNRIVGGYNGIVANDASDPGPALNSDSLNTTISNNNVSGTSTRGIYIYQDNVTLNYNRVYCTAGSSIVIHANALNTKLIGNNLTGSAANISDGGSGTSNKCHWNKDGTYAA